MTQMIIRHRSIKNVAIVGILLMVLSQLPVLAFGQEGRKTSFAKELAKAAQERTNHHVTYDGKYRRIPYPMGDVPDGVGVCTDVVIRSYRRLGIDLQQLIHEDMQAHFSNYPNHWGLHKPDANIDHRRVANLQTFFSRHGIVLPVTTTGSDYEAGDLVTWTVGNHLPHIGIVTDHIISGTNRPMIVHNIGEGPRKEDILFAFPITGHFRYGQHPATRSARPTH